MKSHLHTKQLIKSKELDILITDLTVVLLIKNWMFGWGGVFAADHVITAISFIFIYSLSVFLFKLLRSLNY